MTTADMPTTTDPSQMDGGVDTDQGDAANHTNLRVARSERFEDFLTDDLSRPLYMFAGDVPGTSESMCLGDCARDWPPFDVEIANLEPEIEAADVSRFHRQDGQWQTRYKGHPLYYRRAEAGFTQVTGDAIEGRFYVARDYFTFLATARTFSPEGSAGTNSRFLTDGYGRTLYVNLDDQPSTQTSAAMSACAAACARERPLFVAVEDDRTTLLPSTLDARDFEQLQREDGREQVTYRGWPLYYFSGDLAAGSTEGHNENAWRAFDPSTFGREPESN